MIATLAQAEWIEWLTKDPMGQKVAVAMAEHQGPAIDRIDVEPGIVFPAERGHGGQVVDRPGHRAAAYGDDDTPAGGAIR